MPLCAQRGDRFQAPFLKGNASKDHISILGNLSLPCRVRLFKLRPDLIGLSGGTVDEGGSRMQAVPGSPLAVDEGAASGYGKEEEPHCWGETKGMIILDSSSKRNGGGMGINEAVVNQGCQASHLMIFGE